MTLTPAQQRDILIRTLARAIERRRDGELSARQFEAVLAGSYSAVSLLRLRPEDARVH